MEIIKINLNKISNQEINQITDFLKKGKVIAYPTDTIYGLGCLGTDKQAINKIFKIKNRDSGKPLLVLVGSLAMAKKYGQINKNQEKILQSVWPGPVTVIVGNKGMLPIELTAGQPSLAMRYPDNDFLIKLIKKVKMPIVSTSLNKSGDNYVTNNVSKMDWAEFRKKPDSVIDAGNLPKARPSVIIDIREAEKIVLLRK